MPAPIGVKSLKYRKSRKKSVSCWALCCAVILYMVWCIGLVAFLMAVFEYGGVTPVLRVVFDWTVVPAVGTVVGPATSCAATLGSAVSYVVNATLTLANYTDDDDLVHQAVGEVLVGTGALDLAEGVSALQRAVGESPTAPARPTPVVNGLTVAGGTLWPPFRPAVKRYQVHLDDGLADRCGAEGCPGGAPDIEVELSLRQAGNVRIDREVVRNASGTVRRRVSLEQLFRASDRAQSQQPVIVQVTDPEALKPHSDFYVLKVVRAPERKHKKADDPRVAVRRLADRADLGGAVVLNDAGLVASEDPQARQEQQLPSVQDQVSMVRETPVDGAGDGAPGTPELASAYGAGVHVEDDAADAVSTTRNAVSTTRNAVPTTRNVSTTRKDVPPASAPIDDDALVVLTQPNYKVVLSSKGGYCEMVGGMFETGLQEMSFWSAEQDHILCFPAKRGGEIRVQAQANPQLGDARGEFGFGQGIKMGLRPNIETHAIWPLESGVSSLGIPVSHNHPVKLMGLRSELADGSHSDIPLVVASTRQKDWAVELNFMDPRKGHCLPDYTRANVRSFACRANVPGAEVQLVVICDICSPKAGKGGRTLDIQEVMDDGGTLEVETRRLLEDDPMPWVGWTTNAPDKRGHSFWTITVGEGPEGAEDDSNVVYEVGLVVGPGRLPWDASNITPQQWEALGMNLSMLGFFSAGTYFVVMMMQAFGLPAPSLAALPALSAAAASMQLLAIIGRQIAEPPLRLQSFAKELPPVEMVWTVTYAFLAVVVCHALAVGRHVVRNGSGSAESLPHGLWMGAWELRAFNVLVLPLAYRGATLALVFAVPDYSTAPGFAIANFLETAWGCTMLLGLLAVPACVVYVIRGWFFTEQVVGMIMPGSERVVFVDRTCDQLRTIPLNICQVITYGRLSTYSHVAEGSKSRNVVRFAASVASSILGFLGTLPGWSFSPTTATISEVEHRGSPGRGLVGRGGVGSWGTVWEAGPWGKAGSTSKQEAIDDDLSKMPPERLEQERAERNQELARKNSESNQLKSGEGLNQGMERAETDIGVWYGQPMSRKYIEGSGYEVEQEKRPKFTPVMYAHPIRATTKFVYIGGGRKGRLAGVAGLPWIDCAVPTEALEELEEEIGRVELRVNAGQLCGPHTCGRLGACFDWTDRVAWRWPAEVVGKIVLAFYLAALPYTSAYNADWAWMVLHVVVILGLLVLGVATILVGPHTSFIDNFALASWMLMACAGIFMYVGGMSVEFTAFTAAMSMLFFTFAPVFVFAFTTVLLLLLSLASAFSDLRRQVVPAVVQNWILEGESLAPASSPSGRRVAASGYSRLDPSAQPGSHEDRNQLGESSFPDCKIFDPKLAALGPLTDKLPTRSKRVVTHHVLRIPDTVGARIEQEMIPRGTVPMQAQHIFAQKSGGMLVRQPFGALITHKKGLLLFGQAHLNEGGLMWDNVIKKVLGRTAAAETAIRLLEEAAEAGAQSPASEEKAPLVVVEVEGEVRPDVGRGRP